MLHLPATDLAGPPHTLISHRNSAYYTSHYFVNITSDTSLHKLMARPSAPVQLPHSHSEPPLSSTHQSMASPAEITQQFHRVDALHAQLKAESLRAQDFLLKLRRDEHDAAIKSQAKANGRTHCQGEIAKPQKDPHSEQREADQSEGKEASTLADMKSSDDGMHVGNRGTSGVGGTGGQVEASCNCHCSHQPWNPASEAVLRKAAEKYNPSLGLHTHVDEREVRDLEKRVRGLEGRVRGFEGLPPDREMALLEVERLRRELEGLAKRREGLFEGLSAELVENVSGKISGKPAKGASKTLANSQGNGKLNGTGKMVGNGKKGAGVAS